jgi:hypothetical protein
MKNLKEGSLPRILVMEWMKSEVSISIDISKVLILCSFWTYGYYGAINFDSILYQFLICLIIIVNIFFIFFLNKKFHDLFLIEFNLSRIDIIIFFLIILILFIICYQNLINPISGDHFSYANSSIIHSEQISIILNKKFNFLNYISLKYIYQFINFTLIIIGTLFIYYINIKNLSHLLLCICVILAFRYIVIYNGAGGNQHPPLQLLPLFLTSSFLGINDFSFRITQNIILSIFIFISYFFLIKKLGRLDSLLTSLAIFTIPVILYDSVIVESSIWGSCILTLILIIINTENYDAQFKKIFILAYASSICVLMRIPIVICYSYIVVMASISGKHSPQKILALLGLSLIFLPFFIKSLLVGTPAINLISSSQPLFDFLNTPSLIFKIITNSIGFPYIFFIILIFLSKIENLLKRLSIFFLLITLIFVYFSINHNLWGTVRYVGEYIAPFCGLGILFLIQYIPKKIIPFVTIFVIIFNIFIFKSFYTLPSFFKVDEFYGRQVERVFDYKTPLYEAKRIGLASEAILIGDTYGLMPYVLSGFTYDEIKNKIFIKNLDISSEDFMKKLLSNNPNFSLIIFYDYPINKQTIEQFINNEWVKWKDFQSSFSGLNVIALTKKN